VKSIITFLLLAVLSGCAVNSIVPLDMTPIMPLHVEQVKTIIIESMTAKGYDLRKNDPLVFEKEIKSIFLAALYSSKYDNHPIFRVTITLLPVDVSTKVIINSEAVSNQGSAFERSNKTTANKDIDALLSVLKK